MGRCSRCRFLFGLEGIIMMLQVKVITNRLYAMCPLCRDALEFHGIGCSMATEDCEHCDTPHHASCLIEMDKCGAMECAMGPRGITTIDGDELTFDADSVIRWGNGLAEADADDGSSWIFTADIEAAQEYVAQSVMESGDLECYVGPEVLVRWGLAAMCGDTHEAESWIIDYASEPENHLASYDGCQCDVETVAADLLENLGFTPEYAYRRG